MILENRFATVLVVALCLAQVACSGGSGGGGESGPSVVSPGQLSVVVERESTWPNSLTESVPLSILNPPEAGLYVASTEPPAMIERFSVEARSPTRGDIYFQFVPPAEIGAGTHTGAMVFAFCLDAECEQLIDGSPFEISLTYIVTDPPQPDYPEPEQAADPLPELPAQMLGVFDHDVVQARYANTSDRLITIANQPQPAVHVYDSQMASQGTLLLDAPVEELRLTPDETRAVIRQGRVFSIVRIPGGGTDTGPSVVGRVAIDSSGGLYNFDVSATDTLYASGFIENEGPALFWQALDSGLRGQVPIGRYREIVTVDTGHRRLIVSPEDSSGSTSQVVYDIATPEPQLLHDEFRSFPLACGPLHPLAGRLLSACGSLLRPADESAQRYAYDGIPRNPTMRTPFELSVRWRSATQPGPDTPMLAIQEATGQCGSRQSSQCTSYVTAFESQHFGLLQDFRIPDREQGGEASEQRALDIFSKADGMGLLITRMLGEVPEDSAYALSVFSLGELAPNPPFEPDPGPYNEPVYDDAFPPVPITERQFVAHNVKQTAISDALGLIIIAADFPANALHLYDAETLEHRTVPLVKVPTSLSVAPDGLSVVVGHDARVSRVDLLQTISEQVTPEATVQTLPLPITSVAVDGDDRVHAVANFYGFGGLQSLSFATGELSTDTSARTPSGPLLYDETQNALYAVDLSTSVLKYDLDRSPLGDPEWISTSPPDSELLLVRIFATRQPARFVDRAGAVFELSPDPEADLAVLSQLDLGRENSQNFWVRAVAQSDYAAPWLVLEQTGFGCEGFISSLDNGCPSRLIRFDPTTLERKDSWVVNPVVVDDKAYTQDPIAVFSTSNPLEYRLVSRLHGNRPKDQKFMMSTVELPPLDAPAHKLLREAVPYR